MFETRFEISLQSEAVVRMMEFSLGRTIFKKGLRVSDFSVYPIEIEMCS